MGMPRFHLLPLQGSLFRPEFGKKLLQEVDNATRLEFVRVGLWWCHKFKIWLFGILCKISFDGMTCHCRDQLVRFDLLEQRGCPGRLLVLGLEHSDCLLKSMNGLSIVLQHLFIIGMLRFAVTCHCFDFFLVAFDVLLMSLNFSSQALHFGRKFLIHRCQLFDLHIRLLHISLLLTFGVGAPLLVSGPLNSLRLLGFRCLHKHTL
mmetsp:Transcript_76972/g.152444  ORF Transcript_76972/g.152444 Transcript_76972/m.152444 type:complete len:205 (+) Transcript_76972:1502-2116(+)